MAFTHGKSTKLYMGGYDLSAFLHSVNHAGKGDLAETSVFGNTYKTFVGGLTDAQLTAEGYFDGSTAAVDEIMAAALAGDVYLTYLPAGGAQGARGRSMYGVETSYEVSTAADAVAAVAMEAQSNVGPEALIVNHAIGAEIATGNDSVSINGGAASTNSWAAYIHVTAISGTGTPTITVRLQDSANDSVWADVTGGAFTARTTIGAQRIAGAAGATLRQYTRLAWVISGSSPSLTFIGGIVRK